MRLVFTGISYWIMIECMRVCKHWTGQLDYTTILDYWSAGPRADPGVLGGL